MPNVLQHTLARPALFSGIGVHTGAEVRLQVCPAAPDGGVQFRRTDVVDGEVAARPENVCETRLGTVIGNRSGVTIATIEHLLAALSGLGVDNALVEVDGPEMPILDGSAGPFVVGLDRAGRRPQNRARRYIEMLRTVEVVDGKKRAALSPSGEFEVAFEILFEAGAIGRQCIDLIVDEASFRREVAEARTFGFKRDIEALRSAGLVLGGSLDNAIVVDGDHVLNPEGLRRPDEFVRHKALDAIGDLALLGAPLLGRYEGRFAGHGLNNALVRAVAAEPSAWRLVEREQEIARAS